jgi:cell division protein FtsW (lipid II flippase)
MSPLLFTHVAAGSLGLISGAAALSVRKGEYWHRAFGTVFFLSMLVMAATGAYLAVLQPHRGTAVVGVLTFYFVATAWATARRKQGPGIFEKGAFFVPAGAAIALLIFAMQAANSPTGKFDDLPPTPYLAFAAFAGFVAAMDLNLVLRGGTSGPQRIARHLWRMCFALSFAAATFFLGQQQVFPSYLQGSSLLYAPVLAPLALLVFWLLRVRFTHWRRDETG